MNAPDTFDLGDLRLRRPRAEDAPAIFSYASDPRVVRYMDWPVCTTIEPVLSGLRAREAAWTAGTEFYWVITLRQEDRAIGSLTCQVRGHAAEFGYLLASTQWGKGFGTAVASAVVAWALSVPEVWRVWATCDSENLASARVLEKAGLSREGLLRRLLVRPNISAEPRDAFMYAKVK